MGSVQTPARPETRIPAADLTAFQTSVQGTVLTSESPTYDAARAL